MTLEMHDLIQKALDEVINDDSVGCVVITGAGERAFCAGADITNFSKISSADAKEFSEKGHKTVQKILSYPKPVIAAVNGYALGGGCELATACDFRIASEKARFSQPEISLGLIPGWGGTQLLPSLVGPAKAKELIMTGAMVKAPEALQIGLVNEVVEPDKLEEAAGALAQTLVSGPSIALGKVKKLMNESASLTECLSAEAEAFSELFATEDMKEGVAAFLEKRKAEFKGK
jgi:enoyl-CoA hydratase